MIVYKITNLINGKSYIGQTVRPIRVRFLQHCKSRSHSVALSKAIQKYGQNNFTYEVLFTALDKSELSPKEIQLIAELNTVAPNGYNLTEGGEHAFHTEASKKKLSDSKLGDKNPMFGKKHSLEHKAKISEALTGKKRPPEVIAKIKTNHNPKSNDNLTYRRKPKA